MNDASVDAKIEVSITEQKDRPEKIVTRFRQRGGPYSCN